MLVRELLSLDALQPISSVTGEEGLDNAMKDVVLLEYDSLQQPGPKDYFIYRRSTTKHGGAGLALPRRRKLLCPAECFRVLSCR